MLQLPELGNYPTPVVRVAELSTEACSLWVKRDDLTHPLYGGNKVRKLGQLLADALRRGAERVVTVGGVGSHHVLATATFARLAGLRVDAALFRQPHSPHVLETLRASLAQGLGAFPVDSYAQAAGLLKAWQAQGAYVIPAGGSNHLGTLGIVDAMSELAQQVRDGELPEPDLIVVPLGSGGTVAGLLAGIAVEGLRTRLLAVTVAQPSSVFERRAGALAQELVTQALRPQLLQRLEIERSFIGAGYGHPTPAGQYAARAAAHSGVQLDDTYTAKAFAAALSRVAQGHERTILFWQTLSSAPLDPLLIGAPSQSEISPALCRLLL